MFKDKVVEGWCCRTAQEKGDFTLTCISPTLQCADRPAIDAFFNLCPLASSLSCCSSMGKIST